MSSRPGTRVLVLGIVLVVLAPVVLVGGLVVAWRAVVGERVDVPADGRPHVVEVAPGEDQGVWTREDEQVGCVVLDPPPGEEPDETRHLVDTDAVGGELTVNGWTARNRFDSGDGSLVLVCESTLPGAEARVGPVPSVPVTVGLTVGSVFVAVLLGLAGLVLLVVGLVRRSGSRRPAAPGGAQG
ncbi:hypothetical protein [Nocardioides sp. TF02-7]|uniref:hypothetical protein n=1 Tax=Nocardioides sp. TF02-7 TaxID=2917724 RepID=UPI001F05CA67|nr:hypothetical protein [Nocardioides sp. TF02-7]UMG93036.1 hypothetical protein MF408_01415 [Nocardioides sp. TF02-7]